MSRIGQSPVNIKENVEAILENKLLKLKGPKGFLEMKVSFTLQSLKYRFMFFFARKLP